MTQFFKEVKSVILKEVSFSTSKKMFMEIIDKLDPDERKYLKANYPEFSF